MKRSQIYLRDKLSERELELLKKDLVDYNTQVAFKLKNLDLAKDLVEEVVKNAVDRVFLTYQFGSGGSLGGSVRNQVMTDLRVEYDKAYPDRVSKVIWPDLVEKKPFDRLLEVLQKTKTLSDAEIKEIFEEVALILNGRQQKLLAFIFNNPSVTYAEVSKQFGARGVMTYREIKIVYTQLLQTLKFLEIEL